MTARCSNGPVDWVALERAGVLGLAHVRRVMRDAPASALAQADRTAADLRDRADACGLYIGDPIVLAAVALGVEVTTATILGAATHRGPVDGPSIIGYGGAVLAGLVPHVPPGVLR